MKLYDLTVPLFAKNLKNLDAWIGKAIAQAESKKFEPNNILKARLVVDMLPFERQVQIVCDNAKNACARLAGKEPPAHPDTETSLVELRARIATALAYLETFKPADFEGAEERKIVLPFMPGKFLTGAEYVGEFALANFYFHVAMAYALLRKNGFDLGKQDFIGGLPMKDL
jgi:hypothetical protein